MIQHGKKMAMILMISAFLGIFLLTVSFLLPVGVIREHVLSSLDSLLPAEGFVPEGAISQYVWNERESFTDAIMVQNALERVEGKNAYEHAIRAYHYDLEAEGPWAAEDSLRQLCGDWNTDSMYLREYSRYWHGYLIYLKPLLSLFSLRMIYMLGAVFQAALAVLVLVLSAKRRKVSIGLVFLAGVLFSKPILLAVSLTMSVCAVITMLSLIAMLLFHDRLEAKDWYPEFFLIVGILVAYFDFLTYPVVTLGFLLCACLRLKEREPLFQTLRTVIAYSICWGIGYVGMWAMKWMIGFLTLRTDTIREAAWSIIGWTEAIGGRPRMNGGLYVILLNLKEYGWRLYPAAVLAAALVLVVLFCFARGLSLGRILAEIIPYCLIGAIPFVWMAVVQHHSAVHARYTFRILSVTVMALGGAAAALAEAAGQKRGDSQSDPQPRKGRYQRHRKSV